MNEHAPLIGSRKGPGSFLCHRSSRGCTCQGDSAAKKVDRRIMARAERQLFRRELAAGVYS